MDIESAVIRSHAKHVKRMSDTKFYRRVSTFREQYAQKYWRFMRDLLELHLHASSRPVVPRFIVEGRKHTDIDVPVENVSPFSPDTPENIPFLVDPNSWYLERYSRDILPRHRDLKRMHSLLHKLNAFLFAVPMELAAREHNARFSDDFYRKLAEKDNVFDPDFALRVAEVLRKHNPPTDRVYSAMDKLADHVSPSVRAEDLLRRFEELIKG